MENDSVRSRLIELQSFLLSKFDVDPIHRVLMFLSLSDGTVQDAVLRSRSYQDPCVLLSIGSTGRKNTVCLLLKF